MPTDEKGIKDLKRILEQNASAAPPTLSGDDHFTRMEEAARQLEVLYPSGYSQQEDFYPDPNQMAASEFAPQFAALEALAKAQKARYDTSNADLGRMYESLAQSTLARTPEVKKGFDATGQQIGQTYLDTSNRTTDNFNKSATQLEEIMTRLGLQQAAPSVLRQNQAELSRGLLDLAARSNNNVDTNTRLGQNEVTYLGRTADTNRLAGKVAQTDLMKQLLALQAKNDETRFNLKSQQANAANQYSMGIAKSKQDSASNELANQIKQAQLELEKAKFGHSVEMDSANLDLKNQDFLNKDATAVLSTKAYNMFNGDSSAASNATLRVIKAYQDSGGQSLPGFLNAVDSMSNTNPVDRDRYKQLAIDFWQRVGTK